MSRINTNISSLIGQRVLGANNQQLGFSLERLSTGLRINRGKDDPAGLIASENLRSEISALNSAIDNSERADQVVNIAEGGLQEVSTLLTELQGLLTSSANSAGLSDSEKEANQLQIDSILQTIDRVASSTSFQGTKLLSGNFDYQVDSVASGVSDFRVNGAKFEGSSLSVNAIVTQSTVVRFLERERVRLRRKNRELRQLVYQAMSADDGRCAFCQGARSEGGAVIHNPGCEANAILAKHVAESAEVQP